MLLIWQLLLLYGTCTLVSIFKLMFTLIKASGDHRKDHVTKSANGKAQPVHRIFLTGPRLATRV